MADKDQNQEDTPLPPKLDLRKSGVIKPQDAATPKAAETAKPAKAPAPPAKPPAKPPASPSAAPPAKPKSTTAPIVIPKPAGGAKPVTRPSSAGPRATRPSSAKPAAPAKPAGESAEPESKSETSKISLSSAKPGAPAAARPKPVTTVSSKKETTKIPLEAAKPKPVATADTQATASSLLISSPGETAQVPAVPKPKTVGIASKRKTSRIPLEAALGEESAADVGESTPKTIRIKRPGGSGLAAKPVSAKPVSAKPVTAKTPTTAGVAAKAEDASGEGGEATPTRKKTVVVKRPPSGGAKKLALSRAQGATGSAPATATAAAVGSVVQPTSAKTNEPGVASGIMAIAAVLVVSALIYMFAAQVIGPDKTNFSYATGAPNLAFPGKIRN